MPPLPVQDTFILALLSLRFAASLFPITILSGFLSSLSVERFNLTTVIPLLSLGQVANATGTIVKLVPTQQAIASGLIPDPTGALALSIAAPSAAASLATVGASGEKYTTVTSEKSDLSTSPRSPDRQLITAAASGFGGGAGGGAGTAVDDVGSVGSSSTGSKALPSHVITVSGRSRQVPYRTYLGPSPSPILSTHLTFHPSLSPYRRCCHS